MLKRIMILVLTLGCQESYSMEILSDAFQHNGEIPSLYTCEGNNTSPALTWKDIPPQAKSLALIVEDPDAPDPQAPKLTWVHWVLFNIDPKISGLPASTAISTLPKGIQTGLTNWNNGEFGGPCPPIGRHRYYHKLYALDTVLTNLKNPTADELRTAMEGHIIAEAVLMGTYQKKGK